MDWWFNFSSFSVSCGFNLFSRTFRDDLEKIVDQQLREGGAAGLFALQQHISDITGMGELFSLSLLLLCGIINFRRRMLFVTATVTIVIDC